MSEFLYQEFRRRQELKPCPAAKVPADLERTVTCPVPECGAPIRCYEIKLHVPACLKLMYALKATAPVQAVA